MNPYARHVRGLAGALRPQERARQRALRDAHAATLAAGRLIRSLHRGRPDTASQRVLERAAASLRRLLRAHPFLAHHGAVVQAFGEYVEAHLVQALVERRPPPAPTRLAVPPASYLLGLADTVGEARRLVLGNLLRDDVENAQRALDAMEKVYEALADVNLPDHPVPLRPKIDAARALVERTRGDLVTAKRAKQLEKKIDGVSRLLDEAENRAPPRAKKRDADDLDLDGAWNRG